MRSYLLIAVATTALAAPAQAATVFSENFNAVAVGNYGTAQKVGQFTVQNADVDVFGKPENYYSCPAPLNGDNHCLDLNGNANGTIVSDPLAVTAGQLYTISFKMGGNGEPYAPSTTSPYAFEVSFGGVTKTYAIAPLAPFAQVSFDVTPLTPLPTSLVFRSISQNQPTYWGAILDDITITTPDALPAAVPEPATWAMMIVGFGMVGGVVRRRPAADRRLVA